MTDTLLLNDFYTASGKTKTGEQVLGDGQLKIRVERWIDGLMRTVVRETLPDVIDGHIRSERKGLRIIGQALDGVLLKNRDAHLEDVALFRDIVIHITFEI